MPRRPRKTAAIAIESHGNGLGAVITRYPREFVGIVMASGAVLAVFINALFLQSGPHPAPIFATRPLLVEVHAGPVAEPACYPARQPGHGPAAGRDALGDNVGRGQLTANIQRELTRHGFYDGARRWHLGRQDRRRRA